MTGDYAVSSWTHSPFPGSSNHREYRLILRKVNRRDWRGAERPQKLVLEELSPIKNEWIELQSWNLVRATFSERAQETYEMRI